ncbi:MAG: hypothetical protein QNJ69_12495 [Gammaproteobacteria bacterium]|nr:hypothetical protein [Gammaproteobacteria bacterium]
MARLDQLRVLAPVCWQAVLLRVLVPAVQDHLLREQVRFVLLETQRVAVREVPLAG